MIFCCTVTTVMPYLNDCLYYMATFPFILQYFELGSHCLNQYMESRNTIDMGKYMGQCKVQILGIWGCIQLHSTVDTIQLIS